MSLTLCVPTRARSLLLRETLRQTLVNCTLADTKVVIAMDDDDPQLPENTSIDWHLNSTRIVSSIAPREDSVGAKYNRCVSLSQSDIYVVGFDDAWFTPGWDATITQAMAQFADGYGVVYMPANDANGWPHSMALSAKLIAAMGQFMPTFFPNWWHDTWVNEICQIIGRVVYVDVEVKHPPNPPGTRALRDVSYWATFFDLLRPIRFQIAKTIIEDASFQEPEYRKAQLLQRFPALEQQFIQRNAGLRDPLQAISFEKQRGYDAPADERYLRAKAAADKMLADSGIVIGPNAMRSVGVAEAPKAEPEIIPPPKSNGHAQQIEAV